MSILQTKPQQATNAQAPLNRRATDDEILGLASAGTESQDPRAAQGGEAAPDSDAAGDSRKSTRETELPAELRGALDANPELRRAWQDAQSYRESFSTPEEARTATALLADLDRMDALFFSRRPEDHAELARAVANLDPAAFASLAQAMNGLAASARPDANGGPVVPRSAATKNPSSTHPGAAPPRTVDDPVTPMNDPRPEESLVHAVAPKRDSSGTQRPQNDSARDSARTEAATPSPAQIEFLHAANAAAVQGVIDAIETQVDRLLPEGVSKNARNRVVGEIYREVDAALSANHQLGRQMHDALRSGTLDAAHQRAVVGLVTGRVRQALPAVAKRVLNEWTSAVVSANQDRLARQRAAANRVDIAGSGRGGDGSRRPLAPRDLDYARLSDSDILNL